MTASPWWRAGDGSLHLVVNRLRRMGRLDRVTLGLLPFGTGNDFARAAGVPLDPLAAAVALTTAQPCRFDLLEDDTGRVVVNAAHAGLGAEAAAAAADHKARLGPLAYPLGALRAGTHLDRDDVHHLQGTRVRISGEPVRHNADGELDGEVADRRYLVLPGAWSLLVRPRG